MGAAARMRAAALMVGAAPIARMLQLLLSWLETCAGDGDDDADDDDDDENKHMMTNDDENNDIGSGGRLL